MSVLAIAPTIFTTFGPRVREWNFGALHWPSSKIISKKSIPLSYHPRRKKVKLKDFSPTHELPYGIGFFNHIF